MALVGLPGTSFSAGLRGGYFGGNMGGSTYYSMSGGNYSVDTKGIFAADFVVQYAPRPWNGASVRAFAGIIDSRTATEYGVVRTFAFGTDTSTDTGFTAGAGINVPLSGAYSGFSINAEARYLNVRQDVHVPGLVTTNRDTVIGTVGLEYSFVQRTF